jgi:DNA replication protein DnaC
MTWNNFIEINSIPKKFQLVDPSKLDENLKVFVKQWFNDKKSLVLFGNAGTGKTYFSFCLIKILLQVYPLFNILFKKVQQADNEIVECLKDYGSARYLIENLKNIEYLFLDDLGIDRSSERWERDFYEIIDHRWADEKITIITTNFSPEQIESIYGQRVLSRLKSFEWISFTGKDLREKGL